MSCFGRGGGAGSMDGFRAQVEYVLMTETRRRSWTVWRQVSHGGGAA